MKTSKLTAKVITLGAALLAPVLFFDLGCLIFARSRLKTLDSRYFSGFQSVQTRSSFDLGRGYPRGYFSADLAKGFDISKNTSKTLISAKPSESAPYEVWGNSLSCFDEDIQAGKKYSVYLAGDSFTWGYAPFESKFGQILEKNLGSHVASCGVSHTGQVHQFQKFKEVSASLGYYPALVIVNVYYNDIDNDLSHPHSSVIDGYLVDLVQPKVLNESTFCVERYSHAEVAERVRRYQASRGDVNAALGLKTSLWQWITQPQRYSATFLLFREALQRVNKNLAKAKACNDYVPLNPPGVYDAMDQLYAIKPFHDYPLNSSIAAASRGAIEGWINHSEIHDYTLIFSLIDIGKPASFGESFKNYIHAKGGVAWVFGDALPSRDIDYWNSLRWKNDGHFNVKGNLEYARYLQGRIAGLRDSSGEEGLSD